ncbi:hypothetical protein ACIQJT_38380 [Streptomyces sp. NPDC091972]|uniref:hypothetical protein n=1 Tax=Streptomyces sp. NPDC091972 TaxID=3366007 RepID=UPI0037F601A4
MGVAPDALAVAGLPPSRRPRGLLRPCRFPSSLPPCGGGAPVSVPARRTSLPASGADVPDSVLASGRSCRCRTAPVPVDVLAGPHETPAPPDARPRSA